ncbi:YrrS family protein [Bacillus pinisoli]|uniref:YrrS family protein n=1 Tax=Bacillus pinisoli TaxID=2901866 RepID=UPI001FF622DC|nr:YrrS family protein [Bacillus pinisoli]
MRVKLEDLYEGPRYEKRAKNRRYNKVLNVSIVLVVLLILFFSYKLIFGGSKEAASTAPEESTVNNEEAVATEEGEAEETTNTSETTESSEVEESTESSSEEESTGVAEEEEETEETTDSSNEVIETDSEDPLVKQTVVNKAWKPVSTEQAEPHVASYEKNSVDWQEMMRALEQATDLTENDWILWKVGNAGSEHKAQAVISTKDKKYVYRVYIDWISNEGWKPSKMEVLHEVPAEYNGSKTEESSSEEEDNNN